MSRNVKAYCVRCFEKRMMKDPVEGLTKNGKPICRGVCPVCGMKMCRLGPLKPAGKPS